MLRNAFMVPLHRPRLVLLCSRVLTCVTVRTSRLNRSLDNQEAIRGSQEVRAAKLARLSAFIELSATIPPASPLDSFTSVVSSGAEFHARMAVNVPRWAPWVIIPDAPEVVKEVKGAISNTFEFIEAVEMCIAADASGAELRVAKSERIPPPV